MEMTNEAGLRSFDRSMREKIGRVTTDWLADWLFTPSEDSASSPLKTSNLPSP